ncbi:MAG: DegV family protein [Clostridia bacterium]|nr:DegV family protein [Clostridia bacterium]
MRPFAIITDSSCNLDSAQAQEYGVDAILPMHFYLDGVEHDASCDWKEFSAKDYYAAIGSGARIKSSQVTSYQYEDAFRRFLDQGYDILSISCAEALSGSIRESINAAKRIAGEYPDAKIYCVDSYNCCYSLAMVLMEASKLRAAGESIDNVREWILTNREFYNEVGTVDKLIYLRNAGRVSGPAALFGGIFSVKPIVVYDETGHNVAVEKVIGRRGSLGRVAEYVKKYGRPEVNNHIYIIHGDCAEDAETVGELIQAQFPDIKLEFTYGYVESGVGSSVGPGTIIVDFYGTGELRKLGKN